MVWSKNFHFKLFLDSRAKRERERSHLERDRTQSPFAVRLRLRIAPRLHWERSLANLEPFDFSPFDFTDFTRLRLRQDGTKTAPIAPSLRLRNGWVLMNLTGFDEFFLVGFWWIWPDLINFFWLGFDEFDRICVYLLRNCIIYLFGSWENVWKYKKQ